MVCLQSGLPKPKTYHDLQEEGIILKNPDSEWKPGDRRLGSWVKIKPEYTRNYEVRSVAIHQATCVVDILHAFKPPDIAFLVFGSALANSRYTRVFARLQTLPILLVNRTGGCPHHWRHVGQKSPQRHAWRVCACAG